MPKYWMVNFGDEENLRRGLREGYWVMHELYHERPDVIPHVTTQWQRAGKVRKEDVLIAYLRAPKVYAYGFARPPRLPADFTDTVERTINEKKHKYSNGVIHYEDAEVFYENLREDNGFDGEWGQRIDVEEWLYINWEGVSVKGMVTVNIVEGIQQDDLFGMKEEFFKEVKKMLESGYVNNPNNKAVSLLKSFRQVIITGPPGTSKTRMAKRVAAQMLGFHPDAADKGHSDHSDFLEARFQISGSGGNNRGAWAIVQFHPAYNYEDFVRGIQVQGSGNQVTYQTVDRILALMAKTAEKNKDKKFILIIDEINRANLAAVLGELIYALEYRGEPVHSPYGLEDQSGGQVTHEISIPENLYIIGTMNTADRSIGHIDYAVRRRFNFYPMLPDENELERCRIFKDDGTKKLAIEFFRAVQALFKDSDGQRAQTLSPEFHADDVQPGHTYFMAENCPDLINKFIYQVYPLLREYVKDGILVGQGNSLEINLGDGKIDLLNPLSKNYLEEKLFKLCPEQNQTTEAPALPPASDEQSAPLSDPQAEEGPEQEQGSETQSDSKPEDGSGFESQDARSKE